METSDKASISEWWFDPNTKGVGAHSHDTEDELFYVLEGTMTFLVGDRWREAEKGAFIFIPAGVEHDLENRGDRRAGVLNVYLGRGFEANMPDIVDWFIKKPPKDAV